ncbi:MAG: nicotinamide-nucleotide adenylyltransferase [Infirmifilum sp.]
MNERAFYIGRFQPFHLGHLNAIKWILSREHEVVVAIGSAQQSFEPKNPFTSGERALMIWESLKREELLHRVLIVMIPDTLFEHSKWVCNIRTFSPRFDIAYTNDELSRILLEDAGYQVKPIPFFDREKYSGTSIRQLMALRRQEWRILVPPETAHVIDSIQGEERVHKIYKLHGLL